MKYILSFLLIITNLFCGELFSATSENKESAKPDIIPFENKYNWSSVSDWSQAREKFHKELQLYELYEERKQSHFSNAIKSIITPSWGHFNAQSYTKGQILLELQIILFGSSLYFYDKARDKYDLYKRSHQEDEMDQFYIDANSSYFTSQVLFGLWAIVWAYTMLDVVPATEDYNRNLWEKLKIEYNDVELSLSPQGLRIRF